MTFQLPRLPYDYNALEPFVDTETMNIHHTKHHATYINNLNNYIETNDQSLKGVSLVDVVKRAESAPVRNNAGGHYNHSLFWTWMTDPSSSHPAPHGELKTKIDQEFGSVETMQMEFTLAATKRFGSGWAWLGVKPDGTLGITSTPNQDNPLMPNIGDPMIPILGLDVWEHAYYLTYRNRRPEYINAFWNICNWDRVVQYYDNYAKKQVAVPV